VTAADSIQPRQFEVATSLRSGLEDDEWFHGTPAHRQILNDRHFYPSDEGSSGPGLYLTKSEGWAEEYGRPMRVKVDLADANVGEVVTGQDEIDMGNDPSYDALLQRRHGKPILLALRDTNRITRAGLVDPR
jgi:hypothetical protein